MSHVGFTLLSPHGSTVRNKTLLGEQMQDFQIMMLGTCFGQADGLRVHTMSYNKMLYTPSGFPTRGVKLFQILVSIHFK